VVLYELLSRKHPFRRDTLTATLAAILDETPSDPTLSGRSVSPALGGVIRRCLEKRVEERSPYPGLRSLTEEDAAFYFGREEEARGLWARIRSRRLLALIGPSGVGKTSFVRAG